MEGSVHRTLHVRLVVVSLTTLATLLMGPVSLSAQPWVPPQGEGSVSLTYQNYYTVGHFDLRGNQNTNGATHSKSLAAELEIGLTDKVALTVGLPFIASKYTGPPSYFVAGIETFPGPLDDGTYQGAFQDFRVDVRRLFVAGPVSVAPFADVTIPSHEYETRGEAAPGRRRPELVVGASAGGTLDPILPAAYVQVRTAFGVMPELDGFPGSRNITDLEGGYAITSWLTVRGLLGWQFRIKGPLAPELARDWTNHDRFIVGDYFNAGGGTTISLTRSVDIYGVWISTLSGKNGAHASRSLAVGVSWGFGGGFGGFGDTE
jgi:hypothetical protein